MGHILFLSLYGLDGSCVLFHTPQALCNIVAAEYNISKEKHFAHNLWQIMV